MGHTMRNELTLYFNPGLDEAGRRGGLGVNF